MSKADSQNLGFIFLHRSIRDHWIWKDPRKLLWWIDILMECNHADQKVMLGYDLVECNRGQSVNSLNTWSKRFMVDVSSVRRFFLLLEKDGMIEVKNILKSTRLTVCNYDSYNQVATPSISEKFSTCRKSSQKPTPLTPSVSDGLQDETTRKAIALETQKKRDAIQTITNTNTIKRDGDKSPSPEFLKFVSWCSTNAQRVLEMKEPITESQLSDLKEKFPVSKITDTLSSMHNWEPLLKKNRSAYLTALKWMKKDDDKPKSKVISLTTAGSAPLKKLN